MLKRMLKWFVFVCISERVEYWVMGGGWWVTKRGGKVGNYFQGRLIPTKLPLPPNTWLEAEERKREKQQHICPLLAPSPFPNLYNCP